MGLKLVIKIVICILLIGAGFIAISYIAITSNRLLQQSSQTILKENVSSLKAAEELEIALLDQKGFISSYLLDGNQGWLNSLEEKKRNFNEWFEKANEVAVTREEKDILNEIGKAYTKYDITRNRVIYLYQIGNVMEAKRLLLTEVKEDMDRIYVLCEELLLFNENIIAESITRNKLKLSRLKGVMWVAIGIPILLGIIFGIWISHGITMPIRQLVLKAKTATGEDITERVDVKKGEIGELERHVNRLIGKIEESHRELEENRKRLFQSEKLASLGNMASGVAHEIRNPLTSIKMRLHSLQEELKDNPSQKEDIEVIRDEIGRLESLVHNFLDFVKPPEPNLELSEINTLLNNILNLLSPNLKSQGIEIHKKLSEEIPLILIDKEKVRQVFLNLMLNAIHAMPAGGRMDVSSSLITDRIIKRDFVEVRIKDTGIGIPKENKNRLFDPFFTTKDKGTGLGLSIAYRIVENHRGELLFESEEQKGSTFIVRFPVSLYRGKNTP